MIGWKSWTVIAALFAPVTVAAAQPQPAPRVLLIGTGSGPDDTPVFVGAVLRNVREIVGRTAAPHSIVTLYGDGTAPGREAHYVDESGRVVLVQVPNVGARAPFTRATLASATSEIATAPPSRLLVVIAGHGLPDGAPAWREQREIAPAEMRRAFQSTHAPIVLVDGTCFGGQRARLAACGFFAARPDTLAEGCDPDAALLRPGAPLTDYVSTFFSAATGRQADANHDGEVSLAEAHWWAAVHGTRGGNATYATIDAIADDFLEGADQSYLPDVLDAAGIDRLARHATEPERRALEELRRQMGGTALQSIFVRDAQIAFKAGIIEGTLSIAPFGPPEERVTFAMSGRGRTRPDLSMPFGALVEEAPDGSIVFRRGRSRGLGGNVEFRPDPRVVDFWSRSEDAEAPEDSLRPALITLIRRLALRGAVAGRRAPADVAGALATADACEAQSLADVLAAAPSRP